MIVYTSPHFCGKYHKIVAELGLVCEEYPDKNPRVIDALQMARNHLRTCRFCRAGLRSLIKDAAQSCEGVTNG